MTISQRTEKKKKTIVENSSKIKVGLVQINNSFSDQNYFPYSVGILQAYAQKHLKNPNAYEFKLPIYYRIAVKEAVQKLLGLPVIFFSTYVWNIRISLEIAQQVKLENPDTLIVFGGPQVPNDIENFLRKNSFIDIAAHGEGEQTTLEILEKGIFGNRREIESISYIDDNGSLVQNPMRERIKDLLAIPSPYLDGIFDPLIKAYPNENWIVMWETNRGCPFSCTFCDWGSAVASKVFTFDINRIYKEINWFSEHHIEFIFCADANFGILPRDLDIAEYAAQIKQKHGFPKALSVQNTKNATERAYQVQKTLAEAGLNKGVTISFQSVDPETLKSIKRANISTKSFQELQRRFTRDHIETYSDMILGLPGETYDSFANGVSSTIENGQHNRIQFNNLSILPNAEMGNPEYQKKYGMEIIESKVVNIHGSLAEEKEEIFENQQLVIATNSTPKKDWVRTRAFCWMSALLHFDKILQIPLIIIHETCSVSYRELIEIFSEGSLSGYPVLSEVRNFFLGKAKDIQEGGAEYCRSEKWLNIWWPADEYMFIQLVVENKLDTFYDEIEKTFTHFLKEKFLDLPPALLHEAILLNKSLVKRPFQTENLTINVSYNLFEFYQSVLQGSKIPLAEKKSSYLIDRTSATWAHWEDWFREVVWYGNKKGAYLYTNNFAEPEIAGHF